MHPPLLQRMATVLSHRGNRQLMSHSTPYGSMGYRPQFELAQCQTMGAGLYREGEQVIALAGYLTQADASRPILPALLNAYRQQGPQFVAQLRGAFVLAIQDRQQLHLARDGAGVRTIYYAQHAGRLLFAIEPKGVLAAPGFPRRVRPAAVAQYLTFSFIPGGGTMLEALSEIIRVKSGGV